MAHGRCSQPTYKLQHEMTTSGMEIGVPQADSIATAGKLTNGRSFSPIIGAAPNVRVVEGSPPPFPDDSHIDERLKL